MNRANLLDLAVIGCFFLSIHAVLRYAKPSPDGLAKFVPASWLPFNVLYVNGLAGILLTCWGIVKTNLDVMVLGLVCLTFSVWSVALRCHIRRGRHYTFLLIRESGTRVSLHVQKARRRALTNACAPTPRDLLRSLREDLSTAIDDARHVSAAVQEIVVASPWFAGEKHAGLLRLVHAKLTAAFPESEIELVEEPIKFIQRAAARRKPWGKQWEARASAAGHRHINAVGYRVVLVPAPAVSEKAA